MGFVNKNPIKLRNKKTKKKKQKNNNNKQTKSMKLSASDNPSLKLQKKYDALKANKNNSKSKQPLTSSYKQGGAMTINYAPISKSKSQKKKRNRKQRKRTMCGCQATLHDVFKNCTKCGNILCIIEGQGQ